LLQLTVIKEDKKTILLFHVYAPMKVQELDFWKIQEDSMSP